MNQQIDFSVVDRLISTGDIDKYIKQDTETSRVYPSFHLLRGLALVFAVLGAATLAIGFVLDQGVYLPLSIGCLAASVVSLVVISENKRSIGIEIRLSRLAAENGLIFRREYQDNNLHQGMIFGHGRERRFRNVISTTPQTRPSYELGQYKYVQGSGRNRRSYIWRYAAIELNRNLPHIVLDAKVNNLQLFGVDASNLPHSYKRNQVLSLEGDFDKHFTLYAPKEYKRDALYIFSPDLMALMIDEASHFDAEIIDNRLYFYMRDTEEHPKAMASREYLEQVWRIIELVGKKTLQNTSQYSDTLVADRSSNVVHPIGRRLKERMGWAAILVFIAYIIFIIVRIYS